MTSRREFLKFGGMGLGVAAGFASNLASFNAFAADTSDYKALVCIFLKGGMDSHDLVIPYDVDSSAAYEQIRNPLLSQYATSIFNSRYRNDLLSLEGLDTTPIKSSAGPADGREFAFPEELRELRDLYRELKVAIVANVGPLVEPTIASTYESGAAVLPARLFSHNDQQSMWMASAPEGATTGWGGRFGDIMQAAGANTSSTLTSVSTAGNIVFASGANTGAFGLGVNGGDAVVELGSNSPFGHAFANNVYRDPDSHTNLFLKDYLRTAGTSVRDSLAVRQAFSTLPDPTTAFPSTALANQLKTVAKMISTRNSFGMSRQIFIVSVGGFDTHSSQAEYLPAQQQGISQAMVAFYEEMKLMGLGDSVTQFTASDFGRSLVPNTSGTDHGWGSHQLVLGGAVNGGQFYGDMPEAAISHNLDAGRGRLIPTTSVDQYAYSLGRWFGLSESEGLEVLPNVNNFDRNSLQGMLPWS